MGLKRYKSQQYTDTQPHHILGAITLPRESSQLILMWFNYDMQKKNIAGPGETGYQSRIKLWPMVEHAKKVFWHYHTTLLQQLGTWGSVVVKALHY